jgi:hypothetical protein
MAPPEIAGPGESGSVIELVVLAGLVELDVVELLGIGVVLVMVPPGVRGSVSKKTRSVDCHRICIAGTWVLVRVPLKVYVDDAE